MQAVPKMMWFHYMPQWGKSASDKPVGQDYYDLKFMPPGTLEWGAPGGQGDHRKYGGLWRDRPSAAVVGARPRGGDYKLADAIEECQDAQCYGADGFSTDLLSGPGNANWDGAMRLLDAAAQVPSFHILTMADCNTGFGKQTVPQLIDAFAQVYAKPASYKLPDGRFVISTFKAEAVPIATWRQVFDGLKAHGINVAFWPVFLDYPAGVGGGWADLPETIGVGEWGTRNPAGQASHTTHGLNAHLRGLNWMAPISVQDARPNQYNAYESQGPYTLIAAWKSAETVGANWCQGTTWNDWAEGSTFSPSQSHGHSWLKLNQWFAIHWKTGAYPPGQMTLLSHRRQAATAQGSYTPPAPLAYRRMTMRAGNTPVDLVYLLQIKDGVLSVATQPLDLSKTPTGGGLTGFPVSNTPPVQDLQYTAVVDDETPWSLAVANPTPWAVPITPDPTPRWRGVQTRVGVAADGLVGNATLTAIEQALDARDAAVAAQTTLADRLAVIQVDVAKLADDVG